MPHAEIPSTAAASPAGAIRRTFTLLLVQALVLGLFYSWAYHRTGSPLAPILAHNFSDGALWAAEYLVHGLRGA